VEGDSRPITTKLKNTFLLSFSLLAAGARADVLLTNGSPNTITGDLMTAYIEANSFSLPSGATISGVNFETLIMQPQTFQSTVTYFLYADNSGSPGTQLATGNVAVDTADLGPALLVNFEAFGIDFSLATPFSAAAGTTYWLGLYDGPITTTNGNAYWAVSTGGQGAGMFLVSPYTGPWDSTGQAPFYFQLTSAASASTPEPASTALMSAGLAMMLTRVGRKFYAGWSARGASSPRKGLCPPN
jgi:hypothetical protein